MNRYGTIGILGGMGPEATAELYQRIIKLFQIKLEAKFDDDYPELYIYSLPLPDVVLTSENTNSVKKYLLRASKKLEKMGADFIIIPCNSVEYLIPMIRKSIRIEVISIAEEVSKFLGKKRIKKVGLISTETTIKYGIYKKILERYGIEVLTPNTKHQKKVTQIILNILSGKKLESDKKKLLNLAKILDTKYVILGCTELPLLINQKDSKIRFIDTLDILAQTTFTLSRGN
jgi:aspartate racemase